MNHRLLEAAFQTVRNILGAAQPVGTIVLGSGWGEATQQFEVEKILPYAEIPGLGPIEIEGHEGRLLLARGYGRQVLIFQGRRHYYEGAGWEPVAIPVYLAHRFGASVLILTNAAGGIRGDLAAGDIMIVKDHINALGSQPLVGRNDPLWGHRFPAMTQVYDPALRKIIEAAAQEMELPVTTGIYLASTGPAYETPSEVRAFRTLGADAVGMSTVPEAILAHALGIRVAAVCCITNRAGYDEQIGLPTHRDVLALIHRMAPQLGRLLLNAWEKIVQEIR